MSRDVRGLFAGEGSMDFVAGLVGELAAEVEEAVGDPARLEPDEYYGQVVPCIVVILARLHELTGTAAIPEPHVIAGWRARYMGVWDACSERRRADPDRRGANRAALGASFEELERMSREVHG